VIDHKGEKFAVVHHMVGNTFVPLWPYIMIQMLRRQNRYTYRLADWLTDLVLIEEAGFDAVALNLGPCVLITSIQSPISDFDLYSDCWQKASVDLAYKAAAQLNTKLKLFMSFDMNSFPQAGDANATKIASYINQVFISVARANLMCLSIGFFSMLPTSTRSR
jgi:hypothetical protein